MNLNWSLKIIFRWPKQPKLGKYFIIFFTSLHKRNDLYAASFYETKKMYSNMIRTWDEPLKKTGLNVTMWHTRKERKARKRPFSPSRVSCRAKKISFKWITVPSSQWIGSTYRRRYILRVCQYNYQNWVKYFLKIFGTNVQIYSQSIIIIVFQISIRIVEKKFHLKYSGNTTKLFQIYIKMLGEKNAISSDIIGTNFDWYAIRNASAILGSIPKSNYRHGVNQLVTKISINQ